LAVNKRVAPSTQNQALNALVFLYRYVLETPLQEIKQVKRASGKQKLPVVLNQNEIRTLLKNLPHPHWLLAALMYGSGLRLMEVLRLRVQVSRYHIHEQTLQRAIKNALFFLM